MCQHFERKIDKTYENCRYAVRIADNVQVFGSEKAHDRNFQEAIECTEKQPLN